MRSGRPFLPNSALLVLGVAALTALPFLPALRAGFVNYDDLALLGDARLRGLGWSNVRAMFSTTFVCNYTPLSLLTYGLDFLLWGLHPAGYHLTGIVLHCANAALFALVALELLGGGAPSARDRWAAAAGALLFAAHPLRVESVAWIAERRDAVGGFFFLLAVLSWLRAGRPGAARPERLRRIAAFAFFLSLLSKLSGIMLPFVLILLDVYPLRRLPASPREWTAPRLRPLRREKIPFFVLAAVFAAVGLETQGACRTVVALDQVGLGARAAGALTGLCFYVGKTLWPSRLSVLYGWTTAALGAPALLGGAALAAGAAAACFSRKLRPPLLAAFACYALLLIPVLGFVKLGGQAASDRYSYLPCLAWAALAAAGFRALPRKAAAAWILAPLLIFLLGAATWTQAGVWRDSATLWRHALALDPLSSVAHQDLADALLASGRTGEAILYLEEEVRLYPQDEPSKKLLDDVIARTRTTYLGHARIHNDLGVERAERGERDQALWHFRKALQYDPGSPEIRANIEKAELGETGGFAR